MEEERFRIRRARPEDCPVIMKMLVEIMENTGTEVGNTTEGLREDIFESDGSISCVVAEYKIQETDKTEVIGYSIFYYTYSSWRRHKMVFVEDLFIMKEFRGRGFGRLLMKQVAQIGVEYGCKTMQWAVYGWNKRAIKFYESFNSVDMTTNSDYHIFALFNEQLLEFVKE